MVSSYIKSLKLANHLILTISSNPTFPPFLLPMEESFNQTSVANQQSSFYNSHINAESTKVKQKVRKEWIILVAKTSEHHQKASPHLRNMKKC